MDKPELVEGEPAYSHIEDVPEQGWPLSDTLFYAIEVREQPCIQHPIEVGKRYALGYTARISKDYALSAIPMLLTVQYMDTTGGWQRPQRNLMHQEISPVVRDTLGHSLGTSWGSLSDFQSLLPGLSLRFDTTGVYRMMLTPATSHTNALKGLSAVGLQLFPTNAVPKK